MLAFLQVKSVGIEGTGSPTPKTQALFTQNERIGIGIGAVLIIVLIVTLICVCRVSFFIKLNIKYKSSFCMSGRTVAVP